MAERCAMVNAETDPCVPPPPPAVQPLAGGGEPGKPQQHQLGAAAVGRSDHLDRLLAARAYLRLWGALPDAGLAWAPSVDHALALKCFVHWDAMREHCEHVPVVVVQVL